LLIAHLPAHLHFLFLSLEWSSFFLDSNGNASQLTQEQLGSFSADLRLLLASLISVKEQVNKC
jgi:hypothetical protein